LIVNETARIVPYVTSIFWLNHGTQRKIIAVSGIPEPVKHIPFTEWATKLCLALNRNNWQEPTLVARNNIPAELLDDWQEYLPAQVLWVPLLNQDNHLGGILYCKEEVWTSEEIGILQYCSDAIAYSVSAISPLKRNPLTWIFNQTRTATMASMLIAVALLFLPVSMSINSQAEIVPKNPLIIRAPIDGIIGSILIKPNQLVRAGDTLITFDDTGIRAQIDVVKQELAIAQAEHRRSNQASVANRNASAELPMLRARVEQREAEYKYALDLLERTSIKAEKDGIAVVPAAFELEGKPVKTGEKLMSLAEPGQIELQIWISVDDSIPFPESAFVETFLNVKPEVIYAANVRYISYQAEVSPNGIFSFRSRADFTTQHDDLRIGWRGTAKIYGEDVTLFYYLFRRPLGALRRWTGL